MARLLSSLPVGAKVVEPGTKYNGVPITWVVGGHDHYAQGQTVLVSEKIITLKAFDAKESSNSNPDRKSYGNNRYSQSNIRQWLNSDKTSWYSPQHSADEPPIDGNVWENYNEYDAEPGFLTNFSTHLRNTLITTSLTTAKNTVTDGGGSETVTDRVFLLSAAEVGLTNPNSIAEGKLLPVFTTENSSRLAYLTAEAVSKSEYTSADLKSESMWQWWLRTPHTGYSNNSRVVSAGGTLSYYTVYHGDNGVRPTLNLSSVINVSKDVNSNGEYEIIWPHLTPSDRTDLGSVTDNTSILKYTPKLYEIGTTVTEKINGIVVGTKTIISGTEYTVSATSAQWNAVKYGKYKDTLGNKNVVTLEVSTGEIYTYTFTKTLPTTAKTNDVLVAVNDMSNTAMASHKKRLVEAIGDKATIGGTGTLEDIAKAVDSISEKRVATGTTATVVASHQVYGKASGTFSNTLQISGLGFVPTILIYKTAGDGSYESELYFKDGFRDGDKLWSFKDSSGDCYSCDTAVISEDLVYVPSWRAGTKDWVAIG